MYVRTYVCMYVCMYVYTDICTVHPNSVHIRIKIIMSSFITEHVGAYTSL